MIGISKTPMGKNIYACIGISTSRIVPGAIR